MYVIMLYIAKKVKVVYNIKQNRKKNVTKEKVCMQEDYETDSHYTTKKKSERMTLYFYKEDKEALEKLAFLANLSKSECVRKMVEIFYSDADEQGLFESFKKAQKNPLFRKR